jgi:hypothetical protein
MESLMTSVLPVTKWTAIKPLAKQKHFLVSKVI